MCKMLIERVNSKNDSNLPYKIYLDNYLLGKIKNGESKDYDIIDGKHTLIIKMGVLSSRKINFTVNKENCSFLVDGGSDPIKNIGKLIFDHNDYIDLKRRQVYEN